MSIILIADLDDYLPMSAHVFTNLPAHLNSALNPVFYGIFNMKMRNGYKTFLGLMFCKGKTKFIEDVSEKQINQEIETHSTQTKRGKSFKKIHTISQ